MKSEFIFEEIESIEYLDEEQECYDICMLADDFYLNEPNFIANDFVVHNSGMMASFVNRKRGKEIYELHPVLKPILQNTYGVILYQEQIMKILHDVGKIPLPQCEIVRKAISKKKEKVFKKYQNQFILNGQETLGWSQEQVESLFKQIAFFAEYGFNLAHAASYTLISSRLLYLKAHYPLEFFASILSCKSDDEKIKEYKLDAERNGINLHPLDLNKSKHRFEITDDQIYIGFNDVKGIGEDSADRIVSGQPYSGFEDFINRFGTDEGVLKPLIGLRVFKDADPVVLYEYLDYYRKQMKKPADRHKRYEKVQNEKIESLKDYLGSIPFESIVVLSNEEIKNTLPPFMADKDIDFVCSVVKKYNKAKSNYEGKEDGDLISLKDFVPTGQIDEDVKNMLLGHHIIAQNKFYGFNWDSMLRQSPNYSGLTFETYDYKVANEDLAVGPVEVQIVEKPKSIKSKKGTVYYRLAVEDGNGRRETVTVWGDDFDRFKEEFGFWDEKCEWGNLLKIRVKRPSNGYKGYTFDSAPKHLKAKLIPKNKEDDARLMVLEFPK